MIDIDAALLLLEGGDHELYPKATEEDCLLTEAALGRKLPQEYRRFVTQFSNGAYLFQTQEVSAVGEGNPQIGPIQNNLSGVVPWAPDMPIPFREGGVVAASSLIPFSLDSNGNAWCFVEEAEVAYLHCTGRKLYARLPSFAAWLEILAREQAEVIRSVCEEEVIYDELELG